MEAASYPVGPIAMAEKVYTVQFPMDRGACLSIFFDLSQFFNNQSFQDKSVAKGQMGAPFPTFAPLVGTVQNQTG